MGTGFTAADIIFAQQRPTRFVISKAYGFASSFALISLLAQLVAPTWSLGTDPGRTLFVAVVGGLIGASASLWLARRASRRGRADYGAASS